MSAHVLSGYTDRPNYRPGEEVTFHLSSEIALCAKAAIVRLIHGDPSPAGPGFKQEVVEEVAGALELERQRTSAGSHVRIGQWSAWTAEQRLTVHAFVWPTLVGEGGPQTLISAWDPDLGKGWSFEIIDGCLAVRIGAAQESVVRSTGRMFTRTWYAVALVIDWSSGLVRLEQRLVPSRGNRCSTIVDLERAHVTEGAFVGLPVGQGRYQALIGARAIPGPVGSAAGGHLNGKLDSPSIYAGAATTADLDRLAAGDPIDLPVLAAWDFSAGITRRGFTDDSLVVDVTGNGLHGRTVNYPDRAMTGWNWSGDEEHFVHAPQEYGAIWFHDDAVEDCGWAPSLRWTAPHDLRSGCYALWIQSDGHEDHVPFFVAPGAGAERRIALLIPTFSYIAYANTILMQTMGGGQAVMGIVSTLDDIDLHINAHHADYGPCVYTYTRDGKGSQFSSWRRPIMDMRPRHRHEYGAAWQFPADLYLVDWLTEQGFDFDVITDHDVHREGAALLHRYNVVLTGTHPEYVSGPMLDAWEDYLGDGGRGMYLGGNGFYWVTTPHPAKPWLIEMRRGESGDQGWRAEPGERHHQINGERGGLWRMRGRAPQRLWGVGYGAHGLDRSAPYVQMPDAQDARWRWVFDGVGPDERIGDFGLSNGAAAGLEFDRIDLSLGTPPHAALLASSEGHSRHSVITVEDLFLARDGINGVESPLVRADLVGFTTRGGGAVFSTGSMSWCGSLSHNGYDNNVSAITRNVLTAFAADGQIAPLE